MAAKTFMMKWAAHREEHPGFFNSLGELWCRLMHEEIIWPIHGHYRCRRCDRLYPVPWEEPTAGQRRVLRIPRRQPQIAAA